jgi:hypothetical protein
MLGMSLTTFTLLHVLISLIGIVAGLIAMIGWLKSDPSRIPTAIFLATTILTSVTGFLFPFTKLLPSHIVGIISLVMLALATFALYVRRVSGFWRPIYTVTAILSLYLNVFVLLVQAFLKIPQGMGADADGACVLGCAGGNISAVLRAGNPDNREISTGAACRRLIR